MTFSFGFKKCHFCPPPPPFVYDNLCVSVIFIDNIQDKKSVGKANFTKNKILKPLVMFRLELMMESWDVFKLKTWRTWKKSKKDKKF